MRTTLRDIATYLNVSTTTVSRALNDKGDISPQMRKKVLEVARLLDYKPNSIAISLRKKTTSKLIGVIVPIVNHYFFSTVLSGITISEHTEDDYMIMIGESGHSVDREKELLNRFQDHYVAGIILVPSMHKGSVENVQQIERSNTPLVLIDRTFDAFDGSFIQYDDFQGGFIATQHLINKGRKKIAFIKGSRDCSISSFRENGYRAALKEEGIDVDEDLIVSVSNIDAARTEGYTAMSTLLKQDIKLDGIVAITDQLAAGALRCIRDHDLRVPYDISVVGYSNSDVAQTTLPKLTTVNQDGYEMGKLAKKYLIEMCLHDDISHRKIFPSELIIREST